MSSCRCVVALLLALSACGSTESASPPATGQPPPRSASDPETTTTPAGAGTPTTTPAGPPATTEAAPSRLDTATACARARPCCAAFVEVIGDPVEAERARIACEQMDHLEELGEASGEACVAALDGWRRTLEQAEIDVPTACR